MTVSDWWLLAHANIPVHVYRFVMRLRSAHMCVAGSGSPRGVALAVYGVLTLGYKF